MKTLEPSPPQPHSTSSPESPDSAAYGGSGRGRLRRILLYGTSRGVTEGLTGARGLLLANLLGPESFGVWSLFRLMMRYAPFAGLGVYKGLEREVVQADATENSAAGQPSHPAAHTAVGFLLAVFLPLAAAALTVSFFVENPQLVLGLRVTAAALVTEPFIAYAFIYLRAQGSLWRFATLEVAQAAIQLVLVVLLAVRWGLAGAFVGFAVASIASLAMVARRVPLRPALDGARLRRLLAIGFPLVLTMLTSTMLVTGDRFVVAAYGGTRLLGFYAFAVSIAGLAGSLAWVIRTVIFPDVYRQAHVEGAGNAIRDHFRSTLLPFARWYPPLLGICALFIAPVVMTFLPRYAEAVAPARIFIFTGATMGFASLGALGAVAADRQRVLPIISAFALIINLGLSYLALRAGIGLEGVAAGALLSQALFGVAVVALAAHAGGDARPILLPLRALGPLVACALAVYGLGRLFPGPDPTSVAASVALYLLILLPLVPRLRADLHGLRRDNG